MAAKYLAIAAAVQSFVSYLLDRLGAVGWATGRVMEQQADRFPTLKDLLGSVGDRAAKDDSVRAFGLAATAMTVGSSLLVGVLASAAVGVIGSHTRQTARWAVIGSYIAAGICFVSLGGLCLVIVCKSLRDYATWDKPPKGTLTRGLRNLVSGHTPAPYRLVLLADSVFLIIASSAYR